MLRYGTFNIEIKTNIDEIYFLNVTHNLQNRTYRPYKSEIEIPPHLAEPSVSKLARSCPI